MPDRHVDEEDPVPVDRLGDHSAREQPDRPAGRGDERIHADRLGLLARAREHRHDHPQDHRRGHRAADPLHEAGDHQHRPVRATPHSSEASVNRLMPAQEHPSPTDQVAEPSGQQQQAAEGDQVGVHDPGQRGAREVKLFLDRGQRDVDHRHVEHDHQHPRRTARTAPPSASGSSVAAAAHRASSMHAPPSSARRASRGSPACRARAAPACRGRRGTRPAR